MSDKSVMIAVGLGGLSLILSVIGTAIPYWYYYSTTIGNVKSYFGLWRACIIKGVCFDIDHPSHTLKAVRALEILGILFIAGTMCCLMLKWFVMKGHTLLPKIAGGLAFVAGLLMIIGTIVYATDKGMKPEGYSLHAGFALCVVAGVLGIVTAIIASLVKV